MTNSPQNIKADESGCTPAQPKDYGDFEIALADILFAAMMRSMPS